MRVALLGLLAACTAAGDGETGADTEDTDLGFVTYDSRVEGVLQDAAGNRLAGMKVTLCNTVCQVVDTGADGDFVFLGAWPGPNVLETTTYPGEDQAQGVLEWSRPFDLLPLGEDEHVVLDRPLVVHPVTTQRDLTGAQSLTFGDLTVGFDADAVIAAGLPYPAEELALGATELPASDWPRGVGDWTVRKAWALAVWDLRLDDGFAVSAVLDEAVPDGHEVAFLVADYTHGFREGTFFEEPAELSSDRLTVSTPAGGGLDRTTLWVAASRPAR